MVVSDSMDILIKASNGRLILETNSDNHLLQVLFFTFEHEEDARKLGFDKVIMQAGGIGYGKLEQAIKKTPQTGDKIVILGGENYRIGMGAAVFSRYRCF
jgi:phosphoribosylformylglycinamidine synthase